MEVAALAILATLTAKLLDFAKFLRAKDWNAAFTQVAAWVVGIGVTAVAAASDAFENVTVPSLDIPIGKINGPSLALIGMAFTSLMSVAVDFRKAFDNTDSAKTPPLTSLSSGPPPA